MLTLRLQNLFPAVSEETPSSNHYWNALGVFALLSYSFFWLIDLRISRLAEVLLLIASLGSAWRTMVPSVKKDPLVILFFVWVLFQIGVHFLVIDLFPDLASAQIRAGRYYSKIFLIFIIAWWLRGSVDAVVTIFLATVLGFILGSVLGEGGIIDDFSKLMAHERIDLGYTNWQHAAVYSAFTLLTLVCFWRRILDYFPVAWWWLGTLLLSIGISFSIFGLIATQTRASWLGLIVSGTLVSFVYISVQIYRSRGKWRNMIHLKIHPRHLLGPLLILFFMAGLIVKSDGLTLFKDRLSVERDVVQMLLDRDIDHMRISSIGIRIITWKKALDWIKERPLAGWGPVSHRALIQQSDFPSFIRQHFDHFHNSYIETALAYGIIGIGMFTFIVLLVVLRAWQSWKKGEIPHDLMLFTSLFFIYWLVVNCFESYIISNTGFYLNAIVGGSLYTFHLARSQRGHTENSR